MKVKTGASASRIEGIGKGSLRRLKSSTIKGSSAPEDEVVGGKNGLDEEGQGLTSPSVLCVPESLSQK
jgi:hypothetical protein